MVKNQTLDSLSDLQDSGFGRPYPRHGLDLLYWFVTQCLHFGYNDQITVDEDCRPSRGDYGFRPFRNKERILPVTNLPYYEVGNLNHYEARDLPEYVRRGYTGNLDDSNTDRIIICIAKLRLDSVYATRHKGQWTFNPNETYCISLQLLWTINYMEREDFLRQATSLYIPISESPRETPERNVPERRPREQVDQPSRNNDASCCSCWCCCIAVVILMMVLSLIIYLLIKYVK